MSLAASSLEMADSYFRPPNFDSCVGKLSLHAAHAFLHRFENTNVLSTGVESVILWVVDSEFRVSSREVHHATPSSSGLPVHFNKESCRSKAKPTPDKELAHEHFQAFVHWPDSIVKCNTPISMVMIRYIPRPGLQQRTVHYYLGWTESQAVGLRASKGLRARRSCHDRDLSGVSQRPHCICCLMPFLAGD